VRFSPHTQEDITIAEVGVVATCRINALDETRQIACRAFEKVISFSHIHPYTLICLLSIITFFLIFIYLYYFILGGE
jgi:hypothetical protein